MLSILRVTTVLHFVPGHVASSPHFVFSRSEPRQRTPMFYIDNHGYFSCTLLASLLKLHPGVTVVEYFAPLHAERIECLLATLSARLIMAGVNPRVKTG